MSGNLIDGQSKKRTYGGKSTVLAILREIKIVNYPSLKNSQ